jgi:hypothetical protein
MGNMEQVLEDSVEEFISSQIPLQYLHAGPVHYCLSFLGTSSPTPPISGIFRYRKEILDRI